MSKIVSIPPKKHYEQVDQINARNGQIEKLEDGLVHEISCPDIRVTGVNIDLEGRVVGLRIDNCSGHTVTDPMVTLDGDLVPLPRYKTQRTPVADENSGVVAERATLTLIGKPKRTPVASADRFFPHVHFVGVSGIIPHARHAFVSIAEARGEGAVFLLRQDYLEHYLVNDQVLDTSDKVITEDGWTLLGIPVATAKYGIGITVSGYIEGKHFEKKKIGTIHFQKGAMTVRTRAQWLRLWDKKSDEKETDHKANSAQAG
ncbi:MAG: hypothetical protein AB1817_03720 [Chloroflexota bacterium]